MSRFPFARTGGNFLLSSIETKERAAVLDRCEPVELVLGQTVCEPNEPIRHLYFPTTSYLSLITPKGASASLEVGLIGREGVFGITTVLGVLDSPLHALVQGPGMAMRMTAEDFVQSFQDSASLRDLCGKYLYVLMAQIAQTAACGRFHRLDARAARWMLMTHDRAEGSSFPLTHDFLAKMLGVRRAGVSDAAKTLQRGHYITYKRGVVHVLNRAGLEAVSCDCYAEFNAMYAKHLGSLAQ